MAESYLFGYMSFTLAQALGDGWRCEVVQSSKPYRIYIHGDSRSWVEVRQAYLLRNGYLQIACKHASAEIRFNGSEQAGCNVYSLCKSGETPAPFEPCGTFADTLDAMHKFLNMDTAIAARNAVGAPDTGNKRKAMDE
jgi:hypothetical protein